MMAAIGQGERACEQSIFVRPSLYASCHPAILAADEVSVERGLYISIIGGCHFCHTEGYREAEGKIDPEKALKGSSVGWRGPWGTTYARKSQGLSNGL